MGLKKSGLFSVTMHLLGFYLLVQEGFWVEKKQNKIPKPLSAKLVFKQDKKADEKLLPRKPVPKKMPQKVNQPNQKPKKPEPIKKPETNPAVALKPKSQKPQKVLAKPKKATEEHNEFLSELEVLSKTFEADLTKSEAETKRKERAQKAKADYFDQIYTLVKRSFVLPAHLNDPSKKDVMAILQLFIDDGGKLSNVKVHHPSGDRDFDNAILYATKNVKNFGDPPKYWQESFSNQGVMIKFCPFECP